MDDMSNPVKKYKLENAYEYTVKVSVKTNIDKDPDMCKCEKCYLDVCAIVLNNGFSKFVTTEIGGLLANLDSVSEGKNIDLFVEILKAIDRVKKSPAH